MTLVIRLAGLILALVCVRPADAEVRSLRILGDGVDSRIVLEADEPLEERVLYDDRGGEMRIVVALEDALWGDLDVVRLATSGVSAYEAGAGGRLVLTLDRPMLAARTLSLPPSGTAARHRLVIDLSAVEPGRFRSAARGDASALAALSKARGEAVETPEPPLAADASAPAAPSLKPRLADLGFVSSTPAAPQRYVIVVDPGHGARDPGTQSASGVVEKEVNLKAALTLKELLSADPRFDVRLTRDDDTFIELEDRVTRARGWEADLFISLHADAAGAPSVKGASVYTLPAGKVDRARRTAKAQSWDLPIETGGSQAVTSILESLLTRETLSNSARFAEMLIPELQAAGPLLRNTHREAGFIVLFAPDVPAVLLEMGFLSNADDARRLSSAKGRLAAMQAVRNAIAAYFDDQALRLAQN